MKMVKDMSTKTLYNIVSRLLFYQYVKYPILFIIIGAIVYSVFGDNTYVQLMQTLGLELYNELIYPFAPFIPESISQYIFHILFAYGYGILSLFLSARSSRSIILSFVVFLFKFSTVIHYLDILFIAYVIQTSVMIIGLTGMALYKLIQRIKQREKELPNPYRTETPNQEAT